jgi:cytochrome c-type biogenesis protein CcmH/NrfF
MLDLTNVVLGLWVVALIAVVAFGIFQELVQRRKERKKARLAQQELQDSLSRLGITMRDGGEKTEKDRE